MLNWLSGKSRKNKVNERFDNDTADLLADMKPAQLLAEMLKIPETEVELPQQFTARHFEDGRIYVSNTAGAHGLPPGTDIASQDGLPVRRAEADGLESITLADLAAWMARSRS